jgi:hypothetical protein
MYVASFSNSGFTCAYNALQILFAINFPNLRPSESAATPTAHPPISLVADPDTLLPITVHISVMMRSSASAVALPARLAPGGATISNNRSSHVNPDLMTDVAKRLPACCVGFTNPRLTIPSITGSNMLPENWIVEAPMLCKNGAATAAAAGKHTFIDADAETAELAENVAAENPPINGPNAVRSTIMLLPMCMPWCLPRLPVLILVDTRAPSGKIGVGSSLPSWEDPAALPTAPETMEAAVRVDSASSLARPESVSIPSGTRSCRFCDWLVATALRTFSMFLATLRVRCGIVFTISLVTVAAVTVLTTRPICAAPSAI